MKFNSKLFIKRFGSLLTIILNNPTGCYKIDSLLKEYVDSINHRVKTRGIDESITFFKESHLIATKVAMGRPFDPIPFCKSDKRGIPLIIKSIVPLLKGSTEEKRVGLSITKLYLGLVSKPSTDFRSITDPYSGDDSILGSGWKKFLTF